MRVLLVEDNEAVRLAGQRALEAYGYRVLVAQDAGAARQVAREAQETIQLLVTDVVLPGTRGRGLAEGGRGIPHDGGVGFRAGEDRADVGGDRRGAVRDGGLRAGALLVPG